MAETSLRVALTGGSGFVGRHVLARLLERGHRVRALARHPDKITTGDARVETVVGDLFNPAALAELVKGCDAVIHLVGIIMEKPSRGQTFQRVHVEATQALLQAARSAGVKRWIHMSALGARLDAPAEYHRTKARAEELVRASGMAWTIFQPSIIHGPDGEFVAMVRDFWCKPFPPFVPFFSRDTQVMDAIAAATAMLRPFHTMSRPPRPEQFVSQGRAGLLQPVYVEDVATIFTDALGHLSSIGETYGVGGPDVVSWPQLYSIFRGHLRGARNKPIIGLPAWKARIIARLPGAPFNRDQVCMSQEDAICQTAKLRADFGIELAALEPTIAEYAAKL